MRRLLIRLIRAYQRQLSPLLGPSCRFVPTCSEYAIEAIEAYGVLCGLALAIWRILRCNPFSKGGYDPPGRLGARCRHGRPPLTGATMHQKEH
ncbi:MAG: membrane protein insertion efficiency factor YidD [Bacillota bacterium]|nr:membrane protein insertion efficiency factor YidD [Bacillota bacterium]